MKITLESKIPYRMLVLSPLQCTHWHSIWPTPPSAPPAQPCAHLGRLPLGNHGQDLSNWALLEPLRPLPGPSGQPQPCQHLRAPQSRLSDRPERPPLGRPLGVRVPQGPQCLWTCLSRPGQLGKRKTQRHQGDSLATNAFKISCLYRVVIFNSPVRQGSLVGLFYESVRRTKVMQWRPTGQDGSPHVYQVPVGYLG